MFSLTADTLGSPDLWCGFKGWRPVHPLKPQPRLWLPLFLNGHFTPPPNPHPIPTFLRDLLGKEEKKSAFILNFMSVWFDATLKFCTKLPAVASDDVGLTCSLCARCDDITHKEQKDTDQFFFSSFLINTFRAASICTGFRFLLGVRVCSCCCAWLKESNDFKSRPQSDPRLHTVDVDVFCSFFFFFFILPISSVEQITRDQRFTKRVAHSRLLSSDTPSLQGVCCSGLFNADRGDMDGRESLFLLLLSSAELARKHNRGARPPGCPSSLL